MTVGKDPKVDASSGLGALSPQTAYWLFGGIALGFTAGAGVVLTNTFVEIEALYWLGFLGSALGGGASLLTAFVVFGSHLDRSPSLDVVSATDEAHENVTLVVEVLRDWLATRPFWAGVLGAYALSTSIASQLVAASGEEVINEVPATATLLGLLVGAVVLVILDARTDPRAALALVAGLVSMATGAFYLFRDKYHLGYSFIVLAVVLLIAAAIIRWRGRRARRSGTEVSPARQ